MGHRSTAKERDVVIIDGQNFLFRAHYAHQRLQTSEGVRTSCLFGFPSMLLELFPRFPSADFVVVWDHFLPKPGTTVKYVPDYKRELGKNIYKAKRERSPESTEALEQGAEIVQVLDRLGFLQLGVPGMEADDLIGICTGSLRNDKTAGHCYVLSGDTDMMQLVTERCSVAVPAKGGHSQRIMTPELVESVYGVPPRIFARYLALGGDKSDGYKAIPNVGPVKAAALVREGFNPSLKSFNELPEELQKKYAHLKPRWGHIHLCFKLAYIPRSTGHSLIPRPVASMADECTKLLITKRRRRMKPEAQKQAGRWFENWCAKYEMGSLQQRAYQFVREIEAV